MNDIKQFTDCVGPGWKDIITSLYEDLIKLGWDRKVYQVKEKFGGLRFYIGEGTTEIFDRIALAEEASLETCEECGKPGRCSPSISRRAVSLVSPAIQAIALASVPPPEV